MNPPIGANYQLEYKLLPSPHQMLLYGKESLLAGKIHAILCRNWRTRTKGRDLYDYVFFIANDISVNLELVKNKLLNSNYISADNDFTIETLKQLLINKFKHINYNDVKEDVLPFIKDTSNLDLWNEDFFINITEKLH